MMTERARTWADMPDWISVEEAAEISGYHPNYIRKLIRNGQIEADKKGPMWWIDKVSLKAYVDKMKELGDQRFNPYRDKPEQE